MLDTNAASATRRKRTVIQVPALMVGLNFTSVKRIGGRTPVGSPSATSACPSTTRASPRIGACCTRSERHIEKDTKTHVEKWLPIHPALEKVPREWRRDGFARMFGRPPAPDDLVVPSRGKGKQWPGMQIRSAGHSGTEGWWHTWWHNAGIVSRIGWAAAETWRWVSGIEPPDSAVQHHPPVLKTGPRTSHGRPTARPCIAARGATPPRPFAVVRARPADTAPRLARSRVPSREEVRRSGTTPLARDDVWDRPCATMT